MILAIESSCDESAIAVFDPDSGFTGEWIHSQISVHEAYGGVVPDVASREHLERFGPLLRSALMPQIDGADPTINPENISQIAVTCGPGLAGCLALGVAFAKAIGLALDLPVRGVNHLRGHAFSPFMTHFKGQASFDRHLATLLPHIGLIVSGGNTLLIAINENRRIEVLAETVDDAAGEAIDKGAKLLGMPYPGGPHIEKLAKTGNPAAFSFPTGLASPNDLRFSFSGLKTSLRYRLETMSEATVKNTLPDLCASYQNAVIQQLTMKLGQQLNYRPFRSIGLSGGVANNSVLRDSIKRLAESKHLPLLCAQRRHCGDNAAMIAFASWIDPEATQSGNIDIEPSLPICIPDTQPRLSRHCGHDP